MITFDLTIRVHFQRNPAFPIPNLLVSQQNATHYLLPKRVSYEDSSRDVSQQPCFNWINNNCFKLLQEKFRTFVWKLF